MMKKMMALVLALACTAQAQAGFFIVEPVVAPEAKRTVQVVQTESAPATKEPAAISTPNPMTKTIAPEPVVKSWEVRVSDGLLSQVLNRWCQESDGVCTKFVNQSSRDLVIEGEMVETGEFNKAVERLMLSVREQVGGIFRWRLAPNKVLILSDQNPER